jgi:transcriptional regulator with XRE-family HTH domain
MRVTSQRDLGLLIRERREQLGLTQQAFADLIDVPRLWVATVESGRGNPTLSRLLAVCRGAGLVLRLDDSAAPQTADNSRRTTPDLDALLSSWHPKANP